jgi:hypothetical protein
MHSESKITLTLTEPLIGLMGYVYCHCVYGCCGLDAFDLELDCTRVWVQEQGSVNARLALQQLQDFRFRILADQNFDRFEIPDPLSDIIESDLKLLLAKVEANLTASLTHR